MTRVATLALMLAILCEAAPTRRTIGVFTLFRPERLTLSPRSQPAVIRTQDNRQIVVPAGKTAGFRAVASEFDIFANRVSSTATQAQAAALDGGPLEFTLSVPGRITRVFQGRARIGVLNGVLTAQVEVDSERAVAAIVAAEMPSDSPEETLKAFAIVVRSYLYRPRHTGFDFCDTTHCQFQKEPPGATHPASRAAAATTGLMLLYKDRPVAAMYSASCGGRTTTVSGDYPFFPVECAACEQEASRWERRLDPRTGEILLSAQTEQNRLLIVRKLGWSAVPSNFYTARREGEYILLTGRGSGHGIGLCQLGATGMGRQGASFRAILNHYFPNVSIAPF